MAPSTGFVLGPSLRALAVELADVYLRGELVIVAGAGVSRASGLPGWAEMVATIQSATPGLAGLPTAEQLDHVLLSLHAEDPRAKADSLRRLLKAPGFLAQLHSSLYGGLPAGTRYRPSAAHWHIASLVDGRLMPDVFTSNYDDLLEDAKKDLKRPGRVRHFHGRLPQGWTGGRLADPPVVTTRDYMAAEENTRYDRVADAISDRTALLVGFSLADPNLTRLIRSRARDCRALLIASPGSLSAAEQTLRLDLLRRYWHGLKVDVTAIEAHEELAAFLLALRREILGRQGASLSVLGERALKASAISNPSIWTGARDWRDSLEDAVVAAKSVSTVVSRDSSLQAGFYGIQGDGHLVHLVNSRSTRRSFENLPRRTLLADSPRPWGGAGYSFAAGVPIIATAGGSAFDRNVPEEDLIAWQRERAAQGRLPASSVLCLPAWVRYRRQLVPVGVLYLSSRRGLLVSGPDDEEELKSVLRLTFGAMIQPDRLVQGGSA